MSPRTFLVLALVVGAALVFWDDVRIAPEDDHLADLRDTSAIHHEHVVLALLLAAFVIVVAGRALR